MSIGPENALDPALSWVLRIFIASIFARAVFGKLRVTGDFATALRGYELVPRKLSGSVAAGLLAAECLLVPSLLLPASAPLAAGVAAGVLGLYTLAIGINLARGRRDIDCGCAGPGTRQTLHEMLIARNLVYMGFALVAIAPVSTRPAIWLDGLTIAMGVVCLFALAVAIDGLSAMAATTNALRARP